MNTATGDFVFGMTEAYLIEGGEVTDPLRDGNLIGNGPAALAAIDAVGDDFAMGGPGTCGKDGQGVPVGTGTPTLRVPALTIGGHGHVSDAAASGHAARRRRGRGRWTTWPQLAERWVGRARPGEQLEVAVGRSSTTSVRAYQGDVESFTSATSFGVGIRVIVDGRQGFAHAGTFDEAVIAETLADARDNAGFAEPDRWAGLATPDGVAAVAQDLWRPEVVATPAERKIALALELERAVVGRDPRIKGVRVRQLRRFAPARWRWPRRPGIRSASRSTSCWTSVSALAESDERDPGRLRRRRRPRPRAARPRAGGGRGGDRGRPGCWAPARPAPSGWRCCSTPARPPPCWASWPAR